RLIPLGGFVAFPEDEPDNDIDPRDPDLLKNRPLSQRGLVIAAGVIANVILAWVVLVGQGLVVGIPSGFSATGGVLVTGVQPQQAAA
ncbi:MAG TPA: RIP metalloprotease RseP, partial [Synechococcales bacterium UBA12195]|nr:RIP metalloprotease RseP [Synechococcales bacterium UBA12195]